MIIRGSKNISALLYTGTNDDDYLLADQATSATVTTTVTRGDFINEVDQTLSPMIGKVVVLPGGVTADVPAGDITVVGKDLEGVAQTDTLTLLANQATAEEGALVFGEITSVTFPVQDGAGATYDVGLIPDLNILVGLQTQRLLETRLTVPGTLTTGESIVGTVERPGATVHNFQFATDVTNGVNLVRNTGINLDGLDGFKFHWVWADTDDEDWGFVAVLQNQL